MYRYRWAMPLLVATLVTLGACATPQTGKSDALMLQVEGWLPGHYDNRAQVATDRKHGGPVHAAVSAVIVRVDSLTVGEHVYYMQEADSDDPQQLIAQYVLSFTVVKDRIVEAVWALAEPKRWRNGAEQPELLSSLQPPDLRLLTGCSLEWKKTEDGFAARRQTPAAVCEPSSAEGFTCVHLPEPAATVISR